MSIWVREVCDRRSVRREVRTECQVVAEEGFRLLGIRTLDLSERGMRLHSSAHVELGEAAIVSLKVPGSHTWIDAEAVVTRVVKGRRQTDATCGIGLRFVRMDLMDRAILLGRLYELPPPVPARNLRKDYASAVRAIAAGFGASAPAAFAPA